MSSERWVKRDEVPKAADLYSDIWDGDGWQINKAKEGREKPFVLLDAVMPSWVPASGVVGTFATLEDAMAHADAIGRPDWAGVPSDEEFYAGEIASATQEPSHEQ